MADTNLIRKIYMNCPVCDKEHEVEERSRMTTVLIKGEEVVYEERYFFCVNADPEENEFETGAMMNENLLNARNAYRTQKGLLTSGEIVAIREKYGLSQVDLAKMLGWGEATISRYESKAIQDEAYDNMLRLIRDNPLQALEYLKKNGDKFSASKKRHIKGKITEELDANGREFLTRQALEGEYAAFDEPSDSNGYTLLDIDKLEAVISYFAERMSNIFKTKLMKLLWYADALSFKQSGYAMTGLVYRHEAMGALPIGHYSLMNLENLNVQEEMSANYDSMFHVYPNKNQDDSILNACDRDVLDIVIAKFKNYKTAEIVAYMHEEQAYIKTLPGAVIPFALAKEIRKF
ncbi:MAG: DUF4065 domain-containing protein [Lachnospiraceae bacterium]|nr:DUF4065 domain-containing protein [Lachnospiraceae bacterium]